MESKKRIYVHLDDKGLWTADLYEGDKLITNLGGSYPKSNSTIIDAKKTWGKELEVKIGGVPVSVPVESTPMATLEISEDDYLNLFGWPPSL